VECKHKWVDMQDGTRDKICLRCGKKAKQAAAYLPLRTIPNTQSLIQPILRETIVINIDSSRVTVYKDEILDEISKQLRYQPNIASFR